MEVKKLEAKIEEWAANLGFSLPEDSAPPAHFFSALTATPCRRQLWQTIIESVQDRKKVDQMRKQLFTYYVKQGKAIKGDGSGKCFPSKIQLLMERKSLENKIVKKRTEIDNLEKSLLLEASDWLFDMCKLAEIDKEINELKEKAFLLKLIDRREKAFANNLSKYSISKEVNKKAELIEFIQKELSLVEKKTFNSTPCKTNCNQNCIFQDKMLELCHAGVAEDDLWNILLIEKQQAINQLSEFLKEFSNKKEKILKEKNFQIEKQLKSSLSQLKQEICLKNLQVMINSSDVELLNLKINKLMDKLNENLVGSPENLSYLPEERLGDSLSEHHYATLAKYKNQLTCLRLDKYKEFLVHELSRLENEELQKNEELAGVEKGKEEHAKIRESIENIYRDMNSSVFEQEKRAEKILLFQEKIKKLAAEINEEVKNSYFVAGLNETIEKLNVNSLKQIELFAEIPLGALKTVKDSSGKELFCCETLSHCFENYGGEFKQIFKSLLIHPYQSAESILEELKRRKETAEEINKFFCERKKLSESLKETLAKLNSIERDSQGKVKIEEECDRMLSSCLIKAKEMQSKIGFVKKILHNWVEQPYRFMINDSETVEGKTLMEYEEIYKRNKQMKSLGKN